MTGEGLRHSPILSALFGSTEDPELLGAAQFIRGTCKPEINQAVLLNPVYQRYR